MKYRVLLASPLGVLPMADAAQAAPPTPSPFSWTGFYLGAHLGVQADISKERGYTPSGGGCFYNFAGCLRHEQTAVGVLGGFQLGYNFQSGMWVYGVETDLSLSSAEKDKALDGGSPPPLASTGVEAFGTVRGRLGYLFTRDTQAYLTGGLAYARMRNTFDQDGGNGTYAWSKKTWSAGWTLGVGIERALTDRISVRGEALYYDLGTKDRKSYTGGAPDALHDTTTGWIGRIAINYFFNR